MCYFFSAKILCVKGGGFPLTDKIRKVVFDVLPNLQISSLARFLNGEMFNIFSTQQCTFAILCWAKFLSGLGLENLSKLCHLYFFTWKRNISHSPFTQPASNCVSFKEREQIPMHLSSSGTISFKELFTSVFTDIIIMLDPPLPPPLWAIASICLPLPPFVIRFQTPPSLGELVT